jgi:hypothetical protein
MENHSSGKNSENALANESVGAQRDKSKLPADFSGTPDSDKSTNRYTNLKNKPTEEGGKDQNQEWENPLIRGI